MPGVLGAARVSFSNRALGVDTTSEVLYLAPVSDDAIQVDWAQARQLDLAPGDLLRQPEDDNADFAPLGAAGQAKKYSAWQKAFARWLAQSERIELLRHPGLGVTAKAGESERDFRIRLQHEGRAARDEAIEAVRRKYAPKQAALAERLRRTEQTVEREQQQASDQKMQTAVSMGATLLGALFGRKAVSVGKLGRATTAARGVGRTMKEASDVKRATETVDSVKAAVAALEGQLAEDIAAVTARLDQDVELERIRSRRSAARSKCSSSRWRGPPNGAPAHERRPGPHPRARGRHSRGTLCARSSAELPLGGAAGGCTPRDGHDRYRTASRTRGLALPLRPGSVRFAVIGDSGRGDRWQQEVADQMVAWRARFPFTFVVMLGDNIYGTSTPHDYQLKFERPYKALLDAGVVFHAAIGNYDDSAEIFYASST